MNFLIIKTSSLGDIIHAFLSASYLQQAFPGCNIDWVVEKNFKELVEKFPILSDVFVIDTKKWRKHFFSPKTWKEMGDFKKCISKKKYDAAFDLQGNIKSSLVLSCVRATNKIGFGISSVPEWPNVMFTNRRFNPPKGNNIRSDYLFLIEEYAKLFQPKVTHLSGIDIKLKIDPNEERFIEQILAQSKKEYKILVCPGSNWINKQLPCETLIELLKKMESQKKEISFLFAWGNKKEKFICDRLSTHFPVNGKVLEHLSLPVLQNLMRHMQLVIAMDSLPLHLCGTTLTPSFGVFGPSLASKYAPTGPSHFFYQGLCPYGKTFEKRCPVLRTCSTGKCIRDIKSEHLFEIISKIA